MTVLTIQEQQQIDRANTEGKQPVVFVHGLYLLASSWDNWRQFFEERGYTTLAPGWPDDPESVADANEDPEVFANKRIKQVTQHYAEAIGQLKRKPVVIGHSFGGLIAQQLADEGFSAVTVAIDPAGFRGVLPLPLAQLKSGAPVLSNPANYHRAVSLTFEQFRYGFVNMLSEDEAHELYDTFAVPGSGTPVFQAVCRQPQSMDGRPGQHQEPGAWTTLAHRGRERPYRSDDGCQSCLPVAETQSRGNCVPRNPRPRTLTHHRPRVA